MTTNTTRMAPLAAALVVGCGLLAGCNRGAENSTAENTTPPPAAATPAATAATTTPAPASSTAMASTDTTSAATTSGEATAGDNTGPITDTSFYQQALDDGQKEIAAGKLAEKNGGAKVKDFAKMLVADHTKMGDKVKAAAGDKVTASTTPPDTSSLDGKTGKDFDKAYVDEMVTDHQKAVAFFENASKNASTDQAKKLATDALPTLHKHLDAAQKLQSSMQ